MRKLVTKRKVIEINPIPGADFIEAVRLDGWICVAKKGEFNIGDNAIYFEVDSLLPINDERFAFLNKDKIYTVDEVKYIRLRTVKLKKQISQGLALPISLFPELINVADDENLSELIGVIKYELPEKYLDDGVAVEFPSFIPRTKVERCQNITFENIYDLLTNELSATVKYDGTSVTVYMKDAKFGVCSRNNEWVIEESLENMYVKEMQKTEIESILKQINKNIAIQGELIGPQINKNMSKTKKHEFHMFTAFDIDSSKYLNPKETLKDMNEIAKKIGVPEVNMVIDSNVKQIKDILTEEECKFILDSKDVIDKQAAITKKVVDYLKSIADGEGYNDTETREGVVVSYNNSSVRYKSISENYLLKED